RRPALARPERHAGGDSAPYLSWRALGLRCQPACIQHRIARQRAAGCRVRAGRTGMDVHESGRHCRSALTLLSKEKPMKTQAVLIRRHGGPDVLEYTDMEIDEPSQGQVRVRQTAIGLNYAD